MTVSDYRCSMCGAGQRVTKVQTRAPWYELHQWVVLRPWLGDGTQPRIVAITTSAEAADAAARLLGLPVIVKAPLLPLLARLGGDC